MPRMMIFFIPSYSRSTSVNIILTIFACTKFHALEESRKLLLAKTESAKIQLRKFDILCKKNNTRLFNFSK